MVEPFPDTKAIVGSSPTLPNLWAVSDIGSTIMNYKICPRCNNKHNKPGVFCCRSCANARTKNRKEINKKISDKLSQGYLEKKCPYCNNIFTVRKSQSDKKYCNRQCYYLSRKVINKDKIIQYRKECRFKFNLSDYPNEFDFSLIEKYGWYKASNHGNNLNGVSRDHMYSVNQGCKTKIDPYYISHPANCRLMKHSDNVRKKNRCSINFNELKERINKWNQKYWGIGVIGNISTLQVEVIGSSPISSM